ncbi:hypothetical protein EDD21DRAFT_14728 [Dissophora ornata]|nr:hypothetical protein EDD21DRAFT_14728 [Dissophora ornata]
MPAQLPRTLTLSQLWLLSIRSFTTTSIAIVLSGDDIQLVNDNQLKKDSDLAWTEETMLALLKDIHSVDLCFAFEYDEAYPGLELWAHRVILSRYKTLANMIQKTTEAMSEEMNDVNSSKTLLEVGVPHAVESLVIPVASFSFATLCVIPRYIYTGRIYRSVDTNLHAISKFNGHLSPNPASNYRKKMFVLWQTTDSKTPSDFNTVTWEELLMAADFYGVVDLRDRCESKVISAIKKSNVIETLFNIGCCFDNVKESALDYIVENMRPLMSGGKDPFEPYKFHPECHNLVMEVMRRRDRKA